MDQQFESDTQGRIASLEHQVAAVRETPPSRPPAANYVLFRETVPLLTASPTASTEYADSGSGQYCPAEAAFAIVGAYIEDTFGGVGRSAIYGRGGGVEWIIASGREYDSNDSMTAGGIAWVPLTEGRFDWRIEIAGGASSANVRIELLGYVMGTTTVVGD